VRFADGSVRGYKKLVLAAGSTPFMPKIPGSGLGGIFRIYKDLDLLKKYSPSWPLRKMWPCWAAAL